VPHSETDNHPGVRREDRYYGPSRPEPSMITCFPEREHRTAAGPSEQPEGSSSPAALAQLEAGSEPALIVVDLDMPKMGGREVLARVRQTVATAGLPVLVLTGSGTEDMEAQLMEEGADD